MTYGTALHRIKLSLEKRDPTLRISFRNGYQTVTRSQAVTHLSLAVSPTVSMADIREAGGCVCRTVAGGWWILPTHPAGQLRQILAICYDRTESWHELAPMLAYLSMVMLLPTSRSKVFITPDQQSAEYVLRQLFASDHPLWAYLYYPEPALSSENSAVPGRQRP